jgi:hypothetical protein
MSKKIIYKDKFLGEIELTEIGESSLFIMGESRLDAIYTDDRDNIYIFTWSSVGNNYPLNPIYLRKEIVDIIKK